MVDINAIKEKRNTINKQLQKVVLSARVKWIYLEKLKEDKISPSEFIEQALIETYGEY